MADNNKRKVESVPDLIRRVFGAAWCDDYVTQADAERVFDWIDEHDTRRVDNDDLDAAPVSDSTGQR
jgi:hypothetical protein